MNFSSADAFMRVFPDLVRLVLPKGVVQLDPANPPDDITLVETTAKVLIRDDLHPAIIQLLAQTLKEEHSGAGLFQRSGEFPAIDDSEYAVPSVAIEYYRNGPSLLAKYLPLWMTAYVQRTIAFLIAALAIVFPALRHGCTNGLSDNDSGSFISGSELLKMYSKKDSQQGKQKL